MGRRWSALLCAWLLPDVVEALRRQGAGREPEAAPVGPPDRVAYMHLTKTGGSFIEKVLQDVAGANNTILGFEDPMSLQGKYDYLRMEVLTLKKQRAFTIGSIRNPCEWYLSFWADLSTQLRRHGGELGELYTVTPMENVTDDVLRFRKFVRHLYEPAAEGLYHDPRNWPGTMTTQFAWRYMDDPVAAMYLIRAVTSRHQGDPTEYDGYVRPVDNKLKSKHVEAFKHTLEDFRPSAVDCWVETSSMERDLRACVEKAEQQTTVKMNWTKFEHALAVRGRNPSQHGACRQYYDHDTEDLIRTVDSFVFKTFNYKTCCDSE